ncbi:MAG TPA: hypothetical protein VHW69_00605 [Rhizomicrobium sp.]|nr:hypothetical protein [Rhizomicrobium sp.]
MLDDSGARFLRREPSGKWTQPVAEIASAAADAFTPEIRRAARGQFIQRVMTVVDSACDHSECDRIVTVGPERLLSSFRHAATDRVRVRLWRERAGDVSILTDKEIVTSVEQYFRNSAG